MSEPQPFSDEEVLALRKWHKRSQLHPTKCAQDDPWPCRTARFLVTFDSQSNPSRVAAFYAEWNARLEKEPSPDTGAPESEQETP